MDQVVKNPLGQETFLTRFICGVTFTVCQLWWRVEKHHYLPSFPVEALMSQVAASQRSFCTTNAQRCVETTEHAMKRLMEAG